MNPKTLRITISELPLRASPLHEDALRNVFGGCKAGNEMCSVACDCCSSNCKLTYRCAF